MNTDNTAQATVASGDEELNQNLTKAWIMAALLMFAYTLSFLDRQVISLLITPIKEAFDLTDAQASLLMGPAFAVSYTVMGVPLGWVADRYNRTKLIAAGITLWSAMTALCGLSMNFVQMFMARVGLGVGEATLTPTAVSLLSDKFPKSKLPFAMSVYSAGVFIGGGLAMIGGGHALQALEGVTLTLPLVGTLEYWQVGFLVVASPGILLGIIFLFLREPQRKDVAVDEHGNAQKASMKEAFKYLWEHKKLFLCFFFGGSLIASIGYNGDWYPEHFMRTWGWDKSEAGEANGYPQIFGGTAGLILGGIYMSRLMKAGKKDSPLMLAFFSGILISIPAFVMPLIADAYLAAAAIYLIKFFVGIPLITGTTAIRMSVPNQMRGQFTAIYFIFVGLVAANIGPLLPGFLTTYAFGDDPMMLKYSLSISAAIVAPVGTFFIWIGWQEYKKVVYRDEV